MNRLHSMDIFRQVAESGSFAEVSRTMNIASSSISKQVSELENALGVRLFDRTTRHIRLTEVGRVYYGMCRKLLRDLAEAEATISDYQSRPRGKIVLGAPMTFGLRHLVGLLPRFLAQYPDIDVDLQLDDRLVDVVNDGYDMMVRISDFADTSLIARQLAPCRFAICASPDYIAARGAPTSFAELAEHNCVTYSNLSANKEWRASEGDSNLSLRIQGNVSINNGDALREMALAGVGVALLPTFIVGEDIKAGRLVPLLTDCRLRELVIHVLYPHQRFVPLKVRVLVDYLATQFGPEPPWDAFNRP